MGDAAFELLSATRISNSPSRRDGVTEALEELVHCKSARAIYGTMKGFIAMEQQARIASRELPAADS
jgi:hypothetical protein